MISFRGEGRKPPFTVLFWPPERRNWAKVAQNQIILNTYPASVNIKFEIDWVIFFPDIGEKPPFSDIFFKANSEYFTQHVYTWSLKWIERLAFQIVAGNHNFQSFICIDLPRNGNSGCANEILGCAECRFWRKFPWKWKNWGNFSACN